MITQSILFGNGLNLLNKGTPSWERLIKSIAKEELDKNIPQTLKYEALILKRPYRESFRLVTADGKYLTTSDGSILSVYGEETELRLKKDIAQKVESFKPNDSYRSILELPVEHFMTTNYDNTLLNIIGEDAITKRNKQEQIYSIRRHYTLEYNGKVQQYWPIHGNVDSPRSIMLGFDHYCGALSRVESFVKGGYEMPEMGRMTSITKRLEVGIIEMLSWVDLFFCSDVHIIGQGFNYAEMDLWWILNKRRRIKQKDEKLVRNRIVYYPDCELSHDKRQLLYGFDVEVCDVNEYPKRNRMPVYQKQLDNMRSRMLELKNSI